jgi:hypothetical protein
VSINVIYRDDARLVEGYTNRVASYIEFGSHFGVPSRADTKFNPAFWARDQFQFKIFVSTLFGVEKKRMKG